MSFPIPLDKFNEGASLCLENSERLFNDAKLLFDAQRFASCVTLLIIALEEISKGLWILDHEAPITESEYKNWRYRTHFLRLVHIWKYITSLRHPNIVTEGFKSLESASKEFSQECKELREDSLYVDWKTNHISNETGWNTFFKNVDSLSQEVFCKTLFNRVATALEFLNAVINQKQ